MSETKNPGDKTISVERKTLGLKRSGVEQGTVRQSFSHGRTKAVVVEKKKRRVVLPGQEGKPEAVGEEWANEFQEEQQRPLPHERDLDEASTRQLTAQASCA